MNLTSSHNIQSSNPLGSISSRRVSDVSRSTPLNADENADEKKIEADQQRQDQSTLRQLRSRDREVRAHEAAHVAAGGSLVRGGPSFTLQRGPDGRSYAIGGEVQLDTSAVPDNPEATLRKSEQVRAAALAPAQPSPQDLRVAANAGQLAARARIDIAIQRREEAQLDENQQALDDVSNDSGSQNEGAPAANEASFENPVEAPSSANSVNIDLSSLQSSEQPAAAISNFMSTAQSEPAPVRLDRFA